jgi:hypothetical protein
MRQALHQRLAHLLHMARVRANSKQSLSTNAMSPTAGKLKVVVHAPGLVKLVIRLRSSAILVLLAISVCGRRLAACMSSQRVNKEKEKGVRIRI